LGSNFDSQLVNLASPYLRLRFRHAAVRTSVSKAPGVDVLPVPERLKPYARLVTELRFILQTATR
jgi:hypothetical protein